MEIYVSEGGHSAAAVAMPHATCRYSAHRVWPEVVSRNHFPYLSHPPTVFLHSPIDKDDKKHPHTRTHAALSTSPSLPPTHFLSYIDKKKKKKKHQPKPPPPHPPPTPPPQRDTH